MTNHKPEKLKLTKRIFLFILTLALTNCQDSENQTIQEQSSIKTVSINDAKAFLTRSTNTAKLASNRIGDLEFDKATLEKLNGSDQLLTVIPFATNNEVRNDRVLVVKIDDEIRSVIFSMQPDENSVEGSFSGKLLIYSLDGDFINGYRAKDGVIEIQYVKSNTTTSSTSKTIDGGELKEVIIPGKPKLVNAIDWDAIWGSGGSSIGYAPVGGGSGVTWDSTGGGGASSPSSPSASTPCDQMKKLIDAQNANNMRAYIDALKAKVNSSTNNNEIGVEVKMKMNPDGTTFTYEYTSVVSSDEFSVPITTGTYYIGGGHTHPDNGYGMYSFMDVKFLLDAYNGASSVRKEDVFFMMVAKDKNGVATTYNLKVNDITKLQKEVDAVWNNPIYAGKTEEEKIDKIRTAQSKIYNASKGELEKSFLQQFGSFGVTMYKADANLTKWDKLDFDQTTNTLTIKPTPCN